MWLTDADNLLVLRNDAKMKDTEIFGVTGMPTRSQSHERTRSSRKAHHHGSIATTVREKTQPLWAAEAESVIEDIDNLIEEQLWTQLVLRHQFLIKSTRRAFEDAINTPIGAVEAESFSIVLVHYFFLTGCLFSKNSRYFSSEERHRLNQARHFCSEVLKGRYQTWARILRLRLATTAFAADWNATARTERNSASMRKRVEQDRVFEQLDELNQLHPRNPGPLFNAVALASRFGERNRYQELHERLAAADSRYRDFAGVEDEFIDDDFDDFLMWLKEKH